MDRIDTLLDLNINTDVKKIENIGIASIKSSYGNLSRSEILPFVPKTAKRVLDVGCHMGAFGENLKKKLAVEVWGIEPNPETAAFAKLQLDRVIVGFFSEDLDLPDQYFDVITFNDVLEHMPDPWSVLRLAKRKLAENGCIVASIPNFRNVENLLHLLRDSDFEYMPNGIRDKTHLRFFTKKSISRMFSDCGLTVKQIQGVNEDWWRPSLVRRIVFRLFKNYLDDTKYIQFAVVAQ